RLDRRVAGGACERLPMPTCGRDTVADRRGWRSAVWRGTPRTAWWWCGRSAVAQPRSSRWAAAKRIGCGSASLARRGRANGVVGPRGEEDGAAGGGHGRVQRAAVVEQGPPAAG